MGYIPPEKDLTESPNKWIQENVIELLKVVEKQGHSGTSISFLVAYFKKLAMFEPLGPLQNTDAEWGKTSSGDSTLQNKRLSSVFKKGKNGKPYFLNAIIWKEPDGCCFLGRVEKISSSQYIKSFPFTFKKFYIDVTKRTENEDHKIIDREQLKPVFEYYEKKDVDNGS
jgi:hypothetical protein